MGKKLDKAISPEKIARAVRVLLLRSHRRPGIKLSEFRRLIGKDYQSVLELAKRELERFGLTVKEVEMGDDPTLLITLKSPPRPMEIRGSSLRIDELGMLAATLSYLMSRGERAPRREIEDLLSLKFPKRRVESTLNKLIRLEYLIEEGDVIGVGWRTKAEVDEEELLELFLTWKTGDIEPSQS